MFYCCTCPALTSTDTFILAPLFLQRLSVVINPLLAADCGTVVLLSERKRGLRAQVHQGLLHAAYAFTGEIGLLSLLSSCLRVTSRDKTTRIPQTWRAGEVEVMGAVFMTIFISSSPLADESFSEGPALDTAAAARVRAFRRRETGSRTPRLLFGEDIRSS